MAMDYTTRRFFLDLAKRGPRLTGIINHRHFQVCLEELKALFRLSPTEAVVLLVGPTNVGKSQLLAYLVKFLDDEIYRDAGDNDRPIIGCSAITTRQGRTAPKFALQELLEDVGHPFFHIEPIPMADPVYKPAIRVDETYCLRVLRGAFHSRNVVVVIIDDAHYLVRTKDEDYKASLLEALKGLATPRTTLIIAGGYELANVAFSYRTHFAERLLVVHMPRYGKSKADVKEWRRIIATFAQSPKLHFSSPTLLSGMADHLRYECHGVVGILEKRLITASANAAARGKTISAEFLRETRPTDAQWQTTEADIASGEKLLGTRVEISDIPMTASADSPPPKAPPRSSRAKDKRSGIKERRPFERQPRRALPAVRT